MKLWRFILILGMFLTCAGAAFATEDKELTPPKAWMTYLETLKKEMLEIGRASCRERV